MIQCLCFILSRQICCADALGFHTVRLPLEIHPKPCCGGHETTPAPIGPKAA